MRHIVMTTALVSAAALSSCSDDERQSVHAPRSVEVMAVKKSPLELGAVVTGEVRARVQSDLSFRVSGKLTERSVDVGDRVKSGQVLARIDPVEQQADLEISKASLQSAEAQLVQALQSFDRQKRLFDSQVTPRSSLDSAQEALLTAQSAVKAANANLDTSRDALSYTELRADADGLITARNAEVGQVMQATSAVFTLAHEGSRDAVFDVYESLFLTRDLQEFVGVSLLSDPTQKIYAKIREISPTIDASTGTIKVKVGLNGNSPMPLGAPVSGYFRFQSDDVVKLPWSAMASKGGEPAVWVVDPKSSKIVLRAIDVAAFQTSEVIVEHGLSAGELVMTSGTKFARPDEVVSYAKDANP